MVLKARKLLSAGICAGALLLAASVEAAPVVFSGYAFDTNGSAALNGSNLRLTDTQVQAGSAFTPLTLTNNGVTAPLQFDFTFQIGPVGTLGTGDGFAFVLQNDTRGTGALGGAGSDLGYGGGAKITPSLIVEFDTFSVFSEFGCCERPAPHVAVQKDGDSDSFNAQAYVAPTPSSFADDAVWHARVLIDGGALSVYLDTTGAFGTALLTTPLTDSLGNLLGGVPANGIFYAGFTGGTGGNANVQDILSFSAVAPVPLPAAAWLLLSGLGGLGAVARRRRRSSSAIAA